MLLATRVEWRRDLIGVIDWRTHELEHLGVDVRFNQLAEAEDVVALQPDIVIVATGGLPNFGDLSGAELCHSTWDLLSGDVKVGASVLVYDGTGRNDAPSCAQSLAQAGAKVIYATIDDKLGGELGYPERPVYRREFYKLGIPIHPDLMLQSVHSGPNGLVASLRNELTEEAVEFEVDQVVVERGTSPLTDLYDSLREQASNRGVTDINALVEAQPQPGLDENGFALFRIGDAVSSRSLHSALLDAYRLAVTL